MKSLLTIKQNFEFRALYKKNAVVTPYFVLYTAQNKKGNNRLGITTGKAIGKAHLRNRARRIIRESFRFAIKEYPNLTNRDFLFVARSKTTKVKMQDVYNEMLVQLKKI